MRGEGTWYYQNLDLTSRKAEERRENNAMLHELDFGIRWRRTLGPFTIDILPALLDYGTDTAYFLLPA